MQSLPTCDVPLEYESIEAAIRAQPALYEKYHRAKDRLHDTALIRVKVIIFEDPKRPFQDVNRKGTFKKFLDNDKLNEGQIWDKANNNKYVPWLRYLLSKGVSGRVKVKVIFDPKFPYTQSSPTKLSPKKQHKTRSPKKPTKKKAAKAISRRAAQYTADDSADDNYLPEITRRYSLAAEPFDAPPGRADVGTLATGPGKVGLENLGNTCFMNVAYQALAHVHEFRTYIVGVNWSKTSQQITHQLAVDFDLMWLSSGIYCPQAIYEIIQSVTDRFPRGEEHDAYEMLDFFLESVHTELMPNKTLAQIDSEIHPNATEFDKYYAYNATIVAAVFHGLMITLLECSRCHVTSPTYQHFCALLLPMRDESKAVVPVLIVPADKGGENIEHYVSVDNPTTTVAAFIAEVRTATNTPHNISFLCGVVTDEGIAKFFSPTEIHDFTKTKNVVLWECAFDVARRAPQEYCIAQFRDAYLTRAESGMKSWPLVTLALRAGFNAQEYVQRKLKSQDYDFEIGSGPVRSDFFEGISSKSFNLTWWQGARRTAWGFRVSSQRLRLERCFEYQATLTSVEWACRCGATDFQSKTERLFHLPQTLVLMLKRATPYGKINDTLEYPVRGLDLSPFLHQDSPQDRASCKYNLLAVIYYYEFPSRHYTITVRAGTVDEPVWLLFDDDKVTVVEEPTISHLAYILIYSK